MLVDNDKYSKEKMSNYKNVLYPQIGTDFTYYYKDLGVCFFLFILLNVY